MKLRSLTIVLAVACGLTVANLYYAQPLLDLISSSFRVSQGTATVVVTLTQIGYAAGLLFLLPLGDLVENRRLVTRTLLDTSPPSAEYALTELGRELLPAIEALASVGRKLIQQWEKNGGTHASPRRRKAPSLTSPASRKDAPP